MAALLHSAADVIGEAGYETATMSGIAERAGASIGSLYQFFPNKESLAEVLLTEYCRKLAQFWEPLKQEARNTDLHDLVDRLIDVMVEFFENHPAFLRLLDAPESAGRSSARALFREQLTELFAARKPRMPSQKARRLAIVTQQIMRALRVVYAEAKPRERPHLVNEFKAVLLCYLRSRLEMPGSKARSS